MYPLRSLQRFLIRAPWKRSDFQYRIFIVLFTIAFCLLLGVVLFSNIGEIVSYYLSSGDNALPITILCNEGRLGNQMCTYATLYGLSALNNRRPFKVPRCNVKHLAPFFKKLTAPVANFLYFRHNPWSIISYRKPEDADIPPSSNFIDGFKYPCSYTFFDHVRDEIRREFHFAAHLQQYAHNVLSKANVHHSQNVTYVGVHVRRGDYRKAWLDVYGGVEVNMEYFQRAVRYFRDKYRSVIFILVSDDRVWCTENLAGRFGFYVSEDAPSPAHDLAVLAQCNHTLMTYGTYGFWGGYLAGGEVVYFNRFLQPNTSFATHDFVFDKMFPPQWKGIATTNISYLRS